MKKICGINSAVECLHDSQEVGGSNPSSRTEEVMKTKQELALEVSLLKDRLDKAVVFEVTEDISIGISESDGMFRIRRAEPDGQISFLNKDYQWEEQTPHID